MKSILFSRTVVSCLIVSLIACGKSDNPAPEETIIARVGDRTISLNEFIRRAEFTPRPAYCRGDNPIHKKIVLNSLIAEKLMALEAEHAAQIASNEEFQLYLQGRQEQAMRQWWYYKECFESAAVDTNDLKQSFQAAGRKYRVAFLRIKDSQTAEQLRTMLTEGGMSFEAVYHESGLLEAIPQREITFDSPEHDAIHAALFSEPLAAQQIVGPLKIDEQDYLVMKVLGWTEQPAISNEQIRNRWHTVSTRSKERQATTLYEHRVRELMAGKTIVFNRGTFEKLINAVGPFYVKSMAMKKAAFNQKFWQQPGEQEAVLLQMGNDVESLLDQPLFYIDDEIWSVRDLEREMKTHPLVFRKREIPPGEFAEQFKLAIVDMVRDRYITQAAYNKRYDEVGAVKRNVATWRDNLLFLYQQNQVLKTLGKAGAFNRDYLEIVDQHLTPYIDSLQIKYHDRISIDTRAFEQIELTSIDMLVIQDKMPFPVVVPSFPVVTSSHHLDYGTVMD